MFLLCSLQGTAEAAKNDNSSGDQDEWSLLPPPPYNMCDHGYLGESCEGWVPHFLEDKPRDYMPTPEDLDRLSDGQKEFYARYYDGLANGVGALSALQGAKSLYTGARRWLLGKAGQRASKAEPTLENIAKAYRSGITGPQASR